MGVVVVFWVGIGILVDERGILGLRGWMFDLVFWVLGVVFLFLRLYFFWFEGVELFKKVGL